MFTARPFARTDGIFWLKSMFTQLFSLVRENNVVVELDAITANPQKRARARALLAAIHAGDHAAEIFNDANCYLYLLYIIRGEWLPFNQAMTVYLYVMARQQFKSIRDMSVVSLTEHAKITEENMAYLKKIAADLWPFTDSDCYEELLQFVVNLPPSEQWVMQIPFNNEMNNFLRWDEYTAMVRAKSFDAMLEQILRKPFLRQQIPYFQIRVLDGSNNQLLLFPSLSIIRFCLQKISKDHLEPAFMFGCPSSAVVDAMHGINRHPILLYAADVIPNAMDTLGFASGSFGVALHEIARLCWGSQLPLAFRTCINKFILPNFLQLQTTAELNYDEASVEYIGHVIKQFRDFNLVSAAGAPPSEYIDYYLTAVLNPEGYIQYGGKTPIGDRQFDALYFLMEQLRLRQVGWSTVRLNVWQMITGKLKAMIDYDRQYSSKAPLISGFFTALAENSVALRPLGKAMSIKSKINWQAWLALMHTDTNSEAIWDALKTPEFQRELLTMVTKFHLNFYHPYLPMTHEKREAFIAFLSREWVNVASIIPTEIDREAETRQLKFK